MRALQKLLQRKPENETKYDSMVGYLTKDDLQKLKHARTKPRSPHRKTTYTKWICRSCDHASFYKVVKCTICSSADVEAVEQPTKYELMYTSAAE